MRNRVILLVLALICTGMSMYYVHGYVKNNLRQVGVVVFKKDIDAFSKITNDMVEIKQVSINGVHPQATSRVEDVLGLFVTSSVVKGEPLLRNKLASATQVLNGEDYRPKSDERIIAISTDLTKSIGGTVSIGDVVDVIAVLDEKSGGDPMVKTIAQHIKVVDVRDQNARRILTTVREADQQDTNDLENGNKKLVPRAVLLAVKPREAEQIVLYQKLGEISLSQSSKEGGSFNSSGFRLSQLQQSNLIR